jgi:hypothetical protein
MAVDQNDGRRGFGNLLRDLAEGSAGLVRNEVKLARIELHKILSGIGIGTAMVASGGVFALLGTLALFTGIVLLGGDQWLHDRYWLAALFFTVIAFAVAFIFMRRGRAALSPANLAPDKTVASLKEDKEWLRQRLTSGGTSN